MTVDPFPPSSPSPAPVLNYATVVRRSPPRQHSWPVSLKLIGLAPGIHIALLLAAAAATGARLRVPGESVLTWVAMAVNHANAAAFFITPLIALLAAYRNRVPFYVVPAVLIAPFPLETFLAVWAYPTSHNLWPFEMVVYGGWYCFALLGATAGQALTGKVRGSKKGV